MFLTYLPTAKKTGLFILQIEWPDILEIGVGEYSDPNLMLNQN